MTVTKYPSDPGGSYSKPGSVYGTGPSYRSSRGPYSTCKRNKSVSCTGNTCTWYGHSCPTNGPMLLDGHKFICDPFTTPDATPPGETVFDVPTVGELVTADQLKALRDSILEEYGTRRWILTHEKRDDVLAFEQLSGEVINSVPNIAVLGDFIQVIIDRGVDYLGQVEEYDFFGDSGYTHPNSESDDGFNETNSNSHNISSVPNIGELVASDDIHELMNIVDSLRRSCICNNNCDCFGNCDCNWNCKCNYW